MCKGSCTRYEKTWCKAGRERGFASCELVWEKHVQLVKEFKALISRQKEVTRGFANVFVFYKVVVQCEKWVQCRGDSGNNKANGRRLLPSFSLPSLHSNNKAYGSAFHSMPRVGTVCSEEKQ